MFGKIRYACRVVPSGTCTGACEQMPQRCCFCADDPACMAAGAPAAVQKQNSAEQSRLDRLAAAGASGWD